MKITQPKFKTFTYLDYPDCHFGIGTYSATKSLAVVILDNKDSLVTVVTLASIAFNLKKLHEYGEELK